MSLQTNITSLATRIATEIKALRTLINGNATDLSALNTTSKSTLVSAINEVFNLASTTDGDMKRSTYDTNNNGKVDQAENADAVPWNGITNKPTTFAPAAHDASLVTSGVFDPARIPILPSQKQIVSGGGIAALTTAQQAEIGQGTVVTTTDGQRWVYTGSGSKTLEASYVVLADITPEWSTIASKPTTLSGYGITDAQTANINLAALAGLTGAADRIPYFTGAGSMVLATFTSFGRSLAAAADAAAARTALALGSAATSASTDFAPASHVGTGGTSHAAATTTVAGFMSAADKSKLDGVASGATAYSHPTGDGNLHVPATGTTNSGRVLKAGATAGSFSWAALAISDVNSLQTALDAKANTSDVGDTNANFVTTFNNGLA